MSMYLWCAIMTSLTLQEYTKINSLDAAVGTGLAVVILNDVLQALES